MVVLVVLASAQMLVRSALIHGLLRSFAILVVAVELVVVFVVVSVLAPAHHLLKSFLE